MCWCICCRFGPSVKGDSGAFQCRIGKRCWLVGSRPRRNSARNHRCARVGVELAVALALVVASRSRAQQSPSDTFTYRLPAVVVTASRHEQDPLSTSTPVAVVMRKGLERAGFATVGEALATTPGVLVSSTGPWSQQPVIRGLSGAHVLSLINGLRLEVLRSYGQHAPLLDIGQVERLEVIRGPYSLLYGSDAVGGVVNYLTKPAFEAAERLQVKVRGGLRLSSADQQTATRMNLAVQTARVNLHLRVGARHAAELRTPRGRLPNSQYEGSDADLDFAYHPSPGHAVEAGLSVVESHNVGVPTSPYAERARFRSYTRQVVSVSYERRLPGRAWPTLRLSAHYQHGRRDFEALLHVPKGAQRVDQQLHANRGVHSYGVNSQASILVGASYLLTAGVDLHGEQDRAERTATSRLFDAQGTLVHEAVDHAPPTPRARRVALGMFACQEFSPLSKLILTAGLRADYLRSSAKATPGTLVDLDRTCTDRNVSGDIGASLAIALPVRMYANVGRAFKGPALQERFFKGTGQLGFVVGNPELRPETSLNLDAGLKWRTARWRGEAGAFRNRIDELIVLKRIAVNPDTLQYANVGQALLQGAEGEMELRVGGPWSCQLQGAWVRGTDLRSNQPLPQISPLSGRISVRAESHPTRWWLQMTLRLVGDQRRVSSNESPTPGYGLCDIRAGLRFRYWRQLLELSLAVTNLLNRRYREHLSTVTWWDAPGRNVVLGLTWEE